MGRQYRLKIVIGEHPSVKLKGAFFHISVPDKTDVNAIRELMEVWYRDHAKQIFEQRLSLCLQASRPFLRIDQVNLVVRKMKIRWGSCTPTGRILLNVDLIKAPLECIEYIIMHELCHLAVMDHSPKFWDLLSKCMPDWEKRRMVLSSVEI
jgi:predicted metal-dependent hydrolase